MSSSDETVKDEATPADRIQTGIPLGKDDSFRSVQYDHINDKTTTGLSIDKLSLDMSIPLPSRASDAEDATSNSDISPSVSISQLTNRLSDVEHLPSPLICNNKQTPFQRQQQQQPSAEHGSGSSSLLVKKLRDRSLKNTINSGNRAAKRFISEIKSNEITNETATSKRDFSFSSIKPIQRIVSIPTRSPIVQEKEFNHTKAVHESIDESITEESNTSQIEEDLKREEEQTETENEDIIATFNTFEPQTHELQSWQCTREIGHGSFSKVYSTKDSKYAIKVSKIPFDDEETKLRIQSSLMRELTILKDLNHRSIIKLIGSNSNLVKNQVIMVMPYYESGDLYSYLSKNKLCFKNSSTYKSIYFDILSAVKYLHDLNICHRDIKLENILLNAGDNNNNNNNNDNNQIVAILSDFGLSKKIDPENPLMTTRCGSEDYVSPELLLGIPYDGKQNDCWSLGVLLYSILENRLPFDQLPNIKPRRRKITPSHRIAIISWDWYSLKLNSVVDGYDWQDAMDIVDHLLVKRDERWDIDQVYNSGWFH